MSLSVYRPPNTDIKTGLSQLEDNPHNIALTQLIPDVVQRVRASVMVDRTPVWYYQKRSFGSLCTCWDNTNRQPSQKCPVCWSTGRVGGYNKLGTISVTLLPKTPNLNLVNISLDDTTRPTRFILNTGKSQGLIQGTLDIPPNISAIDYLRVYNSGSYVSVYVSAISAINWLPLSKTNLLSLSRERSIMLKVEFRRKLGDTPSLTHILTRFQIGNMEVNTDKPRISQAISLEDFGIDDAFQTGTYFFPSDIKSVSTSDFFYDTLSQKRWKITEVQPNRPLGIVTSYDVTARVIQRFEALDDFPL